MYWADSGNAAFSAIQKSRAMSGLPALRCNMPRCARNPGGSDAFFARAFSAWAFIAAIWSKGLAPSRSRTLYCCLGKLSQL